MQAEDDYPFLHFVMARIFHGCAPVWKGAIFLVSKAQAGAATRCWVMIGQMHFYKKG
jgi:hypothetical protein